MTSPGEMAAQTEVEGRLFVESLMTDTCRIFAPGEDVLDEDTLVLTPDESDEVYAGRCLVSGVVGGGAQSSTYVAGEHLAYEQARTVKLPASVTGVQTGHRLRFVTAGDPDLLGKLFHVRASERKTYETCRRLLVEEVTA